MQQNKAIPLLTAHDVNFQWRIVILISRNNATLLELKSNM